MEEAELVALRIDENVEAFITALADVSAARPEADETIELSQRIAGPEVDVAAQLARFGRRSCLEAYRRISAGRGVERCAAVITDVARVAEHCGPERCHRLHVMHIEGDL